MSLFFVPFRRGADFRAARLHGINIIAEHTFKINPGRRAILPKMSLLQLEALAPVSKKFGVTLDNLAKHS